MKTKLIAILGILALLAAIVPSAALASPGLPDYKVIDIGPKLRELGPGDMKIQVRPEVLEAGAAAADSGSNSQAAAFSSVGDMKLGLWYDDTSGIYLDLYEVRAIGEHMEVWVNLNLEFPDPADPRNPVIVTDDQINYLVDQFDNNIYPVEDAFFGPADVHDGTGAPLSDFCPIIGLPEDWCDYSDSNNRVIAMISNIGDESYYDPTYPNYIAGFYWGTYEYYFNRNMINIDSFDWANRVGPDGSRPYLYEGVFAHEYQHLLHDDYDPGEVEVVNEGLSMFAEFLTGYVEGDDAYSTFQELPENSLPVWGDQGGPEIVADYGLVFLYQMYLYENFGLEFIKYEFMNPDHGVASINSTLAAFNIQKDFGDLYHDLSVAVLIDDEQYKGGRYGFDELEVAIDIGEPGAPNPEAYDTPGAPPWGADYIWIEGDPKDLAKFTFNGADYNVSYPTAWTSDGDVLWSGTGDLLDNWAIFETPGGGVLSIDTLWDLEDYWDFAFVQVSTDGGQTWTSLADNEGYSTYDHDPSAHPKVVENLPGLTSWVPDWVTLSYDLSAYAGQDILVGFRLVTDWNTHFGGWWIDAVYMDGVEIFDGSDASVFKDITEVAPTNNDFTVTFVGFRDGKKGTTYKVITMKLDEVTEEGLFELDSILNWADKAAMIVTFDAPEGFTGYADYTYDFTYTNAGPK